MLRRLPLLLVLLLLTGCRAATEVDVTAHADGSGEVRAQVTLDREAAAAVPELPSRLRTGDLEAAGWDVPEPEIGSDGTVVIEARRSFEHPDDLGPIMEQLGGAGGAFRDFRLEQVRSVTRSRTVLSGTVDLSRGIETFGDEALRSRVGSRLGFDVNEAALSLGLDWRETFPVALEVHLPGGETAYQPALDADGRWSLPYGEVTAVRAESSGANTWPLVFFGLSGLSILGALTMAALHTIGIYRPKHSAKHGGTRARDLIQSRGRR